VVDAAIVDGSAHMMQLLMSMAPRGGIQEQRGKSMHDGSHFYATYRCADGLYVSIGAMEPQFYAILLEKLDLVDDPRFAPQWDMSRWEEMRSAFETIFISRTREQWCELFEGTDVCFAPVLSPQESSMHPHMVHREVYFQRDGMLQAHPAPRFNGQIVTPRAIPMRGEHTEQVRSALEANNVGLWQLLDGSR
jgi:alpha-methylacyl-CoA racemase